MIQCINRQALRLPVMILLALMPTILLAGDSDEQAQPTNTIEIQTIDYPPFMIKSNPQGSFATYQFDSLFKDTRFDYQLTFNSLARLSFLLESGKWCMTNIQPPLDHYQVVSINISDRPFENRLYRLTQSGSFNWQSSQEMAGKRLAVIRSRNLNYKKVLSAANIEVVSINSVKQGFALLFRNRVDLVLADSLSSQFTLKVLKKKSSLIQESENIVISTQPKLWFNLKCPNARAVHGMLSKKIKIPDIQNLVDFFGTDKNK